MFCTITIIIIIIIIIILLGSIVSITVSMVITTVALITIDGRLRRQEDIRQA